MRIQGRRAICRFPAGKDRHVIQDSSDRYPQEVLMVVVATRASEVEDATGAAVEFEGRKFGAGSEERTHIVSWLREHGVHEVVMESTAQYWRPVWLDLEAHVEKLHLAQAQSNRAPKGRKDDFN